MVIASIASTQQPDFRGAGGSEPPEPSTSADSTEVTVDAIGITGDQT
jgi:hypothetical protein